MGSVLSLERHLIPSLVGRVEADTWENLASQEGLSSSAQAGMWASPAGCVSLRVGEGSNLRGGSTPGSSLQPQGPQAEGSWDQEAPAASS